MSRRPKPLAEDSRCPVCGACFDVAHDIEPADIRWHAMESGKAGVTGGKLRADADADYGRVYSYTCGECGTILDLGDIETEWY